MIDRYGKDAQSIAKYQKLFENLLRIDVSFWKLAQKKKSGCSSRINRFVLGICHYNLLVINIFVTKAGKSELLGLPSKN
jgi:hypothetical protein